MKLMTHDVSGLKSVIDDWCNHSITTMIILNTGHFSNSAKFGGNVKIPWQRANSAARLKILRTAENCGP